MFILLFTLLFNSIRKFHCPFTPYGTPYILFNLFPNLSIQTTSSITQLILFPIM